MSSGPRDKYNQTNQNEVNKVTKLIQNVMSESLSQNRKQTKHRILLLYKICMLQLGLHLHYCKNIRMTVEITFTAIIREQGCPSSYKAPALV